MTRRESLRILAAGAGGGGLAAAVDSPTPGPAAMITRAIPSSGEKLPVIGMGTWQTFDVAPGKAGAVEQVLRNFVELGGKLLDSSPMYGRSEDVAGNLIKRLGVREKVFVATKVWIEGKDKGIEQMQASMRKLKASPIDLMQVHNLKDVKAHLDTLRGWKKDGLVRYLGVTHYLASEHPAVEKLMSSEALDFVQINYSAAEREAEKSLLPLAKERGVAVIANRPFAGGDAFKRLSPVPLPDWAKEIQCTSWAQLLLKFVVSHPAVTCTIPATTKVQHLQDNMKAGVGNLPDEALRQKIAEMIRPV